jgi:ribokinase
MGLKNILSKRKVIEMDKKILVIGSLNMDMVIKVDRIPQVGETVLGQLTGYIPGGKGANQAYAAAKLGGKVSMIGKVGDDSFGETLIRNLSGVGVDVTYVDKVKGVTTGLAPIYVNRNGNNSIVVIPGANENCDKAYLESLASVIENNDIIMFQMEIPHDAIYFGIEYAKKHGKTVILNPAPAPESLPDRILGMIDYITPNETELEKITGCSVDTDEKALEAAQKLISQGVKNIIVTLGSRGAMHINSKGVSFFKAQKVKAVDTTAAGDTFNAALAVYIAEGQTIDKAIIFANQAASISVMRSGAQTSMPTRDEVKQAYPYMQK